MPITAFFTPPSNIRESQHLYWKVRFVLGFSYERLNAWLVELICSLANDFDKGKETKTQFSFQGSDYTAADLGNYHYGATGKAFGFFLFTEDFLLQQAGAAQMKAGTSKPEWQKYETIEISAGHGETRPVKGPGMLPPYGDDPADQKMIQQGFNYYNNNKENLSEED